MKLIEKAPAKINLSLDVLNKRPDGYHEVRMVMTTVDLADRIEFERLETDEIIVRSTSSYVPEDERNLAYKAAKLMKQTYGITSGVAIKIVKEIPVAAGLAGGSSDAAATIRGLNKLWKLNLKLNELMALGEKIGSDVPFCINGGTALATGRGEEIKRLPAPPSCWVVLAKPAVSVSTAETYRDLDLKDVQHPDVEGMISAIRDQDYHQMCAQLGNVLESVTIKKRPDVNQIKSLMVRMDADGVLMSGSGPTVFGLTRHESRLNRICNSLKGFCPNVFAVRLLGSPIGLE
ncbi:4-(cytidine 5'-diphospho)-2-C-methyl-D-erythritol kinase [Pullulanibacillus pueri]|uniref:4-diphosphocytidyl-2-C-methyl-D-erythritol kinase n=1 Tax=Pullulanibacillus pueri TaxID=1437324 RepID=A0A8J3ENL1_9BACL|nr:4-(cytidine 5'-diphospho)-2-C-methyl-D-erythritol kinase [Pullulanibacillus pueri]GGH88322.1 4-diphosphocytidyl-2-C-methyl-D-erythritol kinase [Pullulanibacillus pueri]